MNMLVDNPYDRAVWAGWLPRKYTHDDLDAAYRHLDLSVINSDIPIDQYILNSFEARQTTSGPKASQEDREALHIIGLARRSRMLVVASQRNAELCRSAKSAVPWYGQDDRDYYTRFEAVRDILIEVDTTGEEPRYMHTLRFSDLDIWSVVELPEPFEHYFINDIGEVVSPLAFSWLAKDTKATASRFPAILEVIRHIKDCEYAMVALTEGIKYVPREYTEDLHAARAAIHIKLQGLQEKLCESTESSSFNDVFRHDQANATCSDALVLPEILEHILGFLPVKDILSVQQTSKTHFDIIKGSAKLQYYMGLPSEFQGHHHLPLGDGLAKYPDFTCRSSSRHGSLLAPTPYHLEQWRNQTEPPTDLADASVHATIWASATGRLPAIGERYRSMLVCLPPITRMSIRVTYHTTVCGMYNSNTLEIRPRPRYGDADFPDVTATAAGLTLGDLWDAANDLLCEETMCMNPDYAPTVKNSYEVHFFGTVRSRYDEAISRPCRSLEVDDSVVTCRDKEEQEALEQHLARAAEECRVHDARIEAYSKVMRAAKMVDRRYPTDKELSDAWSAVREAIDEIANGDEGAVGE
ncbi:ubiquitin-specific protease ubp2 [Elasticomyces elasticus]|nr:ubiquitin-specific protease ubp2 [Elasticomyces elasticus]KAK3664251.1 ubiquitin-specific protease ubp2 [Elasticomyces elasticus]KAK4931467.1 ubiquitin-specific protease ubp2 [Elasticomyces elasticus]KAK5766014.1 ubiquitin-specific protease ubp2 [Elasticomyces elasticus]